MGRAWKTGLEAAGCEGTDGAVVIFFGGLDGVGHEFGEDGGSSLDTGVDEEAGAGCGMDWRMAWVDQDLVGRPGGGEADLRSAVDQAFQMADRVTGFAEAGDQG